MDVTLPALHQEAIVSRDEIYSSARKAKAAAYPRKDSSGRLLKENFCVPFILTSMGGLCQEGHDFLRLCKKRNKGATLRLLDVLATQHAKWTARRIRRALFGQSLVDFSGSSWSSIKIHKSRDSDTALVVNKGKAKVSRMVREFSQTAAEDTQPHQPAQDCPSLVPGMSQYSESQEFSEVGTAADRMSLSTSAANNTEFSQSIVGVGPSRPVTPPNSDRAQESTNCNRNFSPASK